MPKIKLKEAKSVVGNANDGLDNLNQNAIKRKVGRPKSGHTKKTTCLRLDIEVIQAFKSTGKGWHSRINIALIDWLKENKL